MKNILAFPGRNEIKALRFNKLISEVQKIIIAIESNTKQKKVIPPVSEVERAEIRNMTDLKMIDEILSSTAVEVDRNPAFYKYLVNEATKRGLLKQ